MVAITEAQQARVQPTKQVQELEDLLSKEQSVRQELERLNSALASQNETLKDVVYSLSHDLKEPSRNTNISLGLLARQLTGKLNQVDHEMLSQAMDSAARLNRMLSDMLAYCRIDQEKELTRVSIRSLLEVVQENLAFSLQDTGAQICIGEMPEAVCFRVTIVQLFQNLITNAIKYRRDATPCIVISARKDGRFWLFSVRDNGRGFPQSASEKIFRMFTQLDGAARNDGSSSGIGLALCRKIVEAHGGRIWAESKVGEGSTFFFTIPIDLTPAV